MPSLTAGDADKRPGVSAASAAPLPQQPSSSSSSGNSGALSSKGIPADKICLRLILVSGRTAEFVLPPEWSAQQVAQHVFAHWPPDWDAERVPQAGLLKLIYHGRFLHHNVTLAALCLPPGKTTVMHLVARENLPEPNSHDSPHKRKSPCCRCCSLM